MRIRWSSHVEDKIAKELSKLGVTKDLLEEIVKVPDEVLYDSVSGRYVASKLKCNVAVIYERDVEDMFIITAIYSSKLDDVILRRKRSGRWI
ncbi:MAG: hypothetical protein ABR909_09230 [Candidatus Bathyarchaeia archaeon]